MVGKDLLPDFAFILKFIIVFKISGTPVISPVSLLKLKFGTKCVPSVNLYSYNNIFKVSLSFIVNLYPVSILYISWRSVYSHVGSCSSLYISLDNIFFSG